MLTGARAKEVDSELGRAWASIDVPAAKPFYGRLTAGSDGTFWAGPNDNLGQETTMTAFGPDGRFEGILRFAGRFVVHDSGPGWLLGVMYDENDMEFVQLYER